MNDSSRIAGWGTGQKGVEDKKAPAGESGRAGIGPKGAGLADAFEGVAATGALAAHRALTRVVAPEKVLYALRILVEVVGGDAPRKRVCEFCGELGLYVSVGVQRYA